MTGQAFVVVYCARTGRPMTGRLIRQRNDWKLADLHVREGSGIAQTEEAADHLEWNWKVARGYTGCPECGNRWFAQCDGCRALSCWRSRGWRGARGHFACVACGLEDKLVIVPGVNLRVDDLG